MTPIENLVYFIHERYRIYVRRFDYKYPKPWTDDPILQKYRFCNVFREHDTVTQWIANNWRFPNQFEPDLWFAMVVARLLNTPASLQLIGYPVPWNPRKFLKVLKAAQEDSRKVFSSAYIVSTNGVKMNKLEYLEQQVLTPMWKERKELRPQVRKAGKVWQSEPLWEIYTRLVTCKGMGTFMAAQVIADIKYTPPLSGAADWWTFAASGPGSRRGLNRVLSRSVNAPWKEREWKSQLLALKAQIDPLLNRASEDQRMKRLDKLIMPAMHAQDLQNCLCEFDKYERARLGEGTPRQLYNGVC